MKNCDHCGSITPNPRFCSKRCAATVTNTERVKKKIRCRSCNSELPRDRYAVRRTVCDDCNRNIVDWNQVTYGEEKRRRKYQPNYRIRELARTAYKKSGRQLKCEACGYDTHVVIHHKKAISSHSDDTSIAEINKLSNLMCLCPNHHWEIHNGCFTQT